MFAEVSSNLLGSCMYAEVGSFVRENVCLLMCAPICWGPLLGKMYVCWCMLPFAGVVC